MGKPNGTGPTRSGRNPNGQPKAYGPRNVEKRKTSELWREALKESDKKIKEEIQRLVQTENYVQIDQLIELVRQKNNSFEADTRGINFHGKYIILRDCVASVIKGLIIVFDVAVPFAPAPAPLVWAAFKVLLEANATQCKEMTAVLGCVDKVLALVNLGAIYEHAFLKKKKKNSSEVHKCSTTLRESLVDAYKKALKLLVEAKRKVEKNAFQALWDALHKPNEIGVLIEDLRDAEDRVIKNAGACEIEQGSVRYNRICQHFGYLERSVTEIGRIISKNEREKALRFVSQAPVGNQHHERTQRRLEENDNWLLQHRKFLKWKDSRSSKILWLTGSVGAGKTILASYVIDHCKKDDPPKSPDVPKSSDALESLDVIRSLHVQKSQAMAKALAFFYYSKGDQAARDEPIAYVLGSFVKQLFTLPCCSAKLQEKLIERIEGAKRAHRTFLNQKECEKFLLDFVNETPRTFLILDGLDEFPEQAANGIIITLKKLIQKSRGLVKLFLSSRDEGHIRDTLRANKDKSASSENKPPFSEINIGDKNRTDIERYVETRTKKNFRRFAKGEQKLLAKRLVSGANGMFRWAYLQMEQLKKCITWGAILERLDNLPKGLTESYDELYGKSEGEDRKYLQRAVKWVMFACEPLSTEELLSAIRLGQGTDGTLEIDDRLKETELEKICRHFIYKNSKGYWGFSHASVKEYFQDKGKQNETLKDWNADAAQVDLAKLLVLLFTGYEKWPKDTRKLWTKSQKNCKKEKSLHYKDPQNSLRLYVACYWASHVRDIQDLPLNKAQVLQLFQLFQTFMTTGEAPFESSRQYQEWIKAKPRGISGLGGHHQSQNYATALPAKKLIFGIVALGLFPMLETPMQEIWGIKHKKPNTSKNSEKYVDLGQKDEMGRSLLAIAARCGYTETCTRLIALGCKVNNVFPVKRSRSTEGDDYHSTALFEAVAMGQTECVEILLKKGANANLETNTRALCQAAGCGDVTILKLLLKSGANVNDACQNCKFKYALDRAIDGEGTAAMEILRQAGALSKPEETV